MPLSDYLNNDGNELERQTSSISALLKTKEQQAKATQNIDDSFRSLIEANALLVANAKAHQENATKRIDALVTQIDDLRQENHDSLSDIVNEQKEMNAKIVKNFNVIAKGFDARIEQLAQKQAQEHKQALATVSSEAQKQVKAMAQSQIEQVKNIESVIDKASKQQRKTIQASSLAGLLFDTKGFWIVFFTFAYSVVNFSFAGALFVENLLDSAKYHQGFEWLLTSIFAPFTALFFAFIASLVVTATVMILTYDTYNDEYDFKGWQVATVAVGGLLASTAYMFGFYNWFY